MRRILVNALSVTNQSGLHVLRGHLDQAAAALADRVRFVVVGRADQTALRAGLGDRADWETAPATTRNWLRRVLWERVHLPRLARRHSACAYFTPNGIAASGLDTPQIVFCQNPWALTPAARRRRDALKAWLQRRAYRRAMRTAEALVFNSHFMQAAYRRNAGFREKRGVVVYQAPDDDTCARAAALGDVPRRAGQVLCVSAMAPHKNAEAMVCALHRLHAAGRAEARLVFAGAWPDAAYARKIRALVTRLGLEAAVEFKGHLPREELDRLYAESQVFCLPSRCESFGIPAVEAQLFGTPVVGATAGAMAEIGGEGGLFCAPDDVPALAAALETLLGDAAEWRRRSDLARRNAERFAWNRVSRPLVNLFAEFAGFPGDPA